jgi:hypothetical protein
MGRLRSFAHRQYVRDDVVGDRRGEVEPSSALADGARAVGAGAVAAGGAEGVAAVSAGGAAGCSDGIGATLADGAAAAGAGAVAAGGTEGAGALGAGGAAGCSDGIAAGLPDAIPAVGAGGVVDGGVNEAVGATDLPVAGGTGGSGTTVCRPLLKRESSRLATSSRPTDRTTTDRATQLNLILTA